MVAAPILKFLVPILLAFAGVDWVRGEHHAHHHVHVRKAVETKVVSVPVKMFKYNGNVIPMSDVCAGILNGTLHWAPDSYDTPECDSLIAASTSTVVSGPRPQGHIITVTATMHSIPPSTGRYLPAKNSNANHVASADASAHLSSSVVQKSAHSSAHSDLHSVNSAGLPVQSGLQSTLATSSKTHAMPIATDQVSGLGASFLQTNPNVGMEFPDGQLDCSEFPSSYGAIHVPWMNFGGWTGIQFAQLSDNAVVGLSTGITGNQCADGQDGSTTFCSYACPPGYQKSQWPQSQGGSSMAVSVGGLKCQNGKLHLTNPSLSMYLCIPGTGKSFVSNNLNGSASICRTDYPGTEDETIPLQTQSGNVYPLTCPDTSEYYQHLGAQTSAEYYVNNKNIPVDVACQWDTDGSDQGNWAPVVIGAETDSSGATWLSIMTSRQNNPVNYQELDFSIELAGDFGGAACFYTQYNNVGYYCSSGKLANFSPTQKGCKTFDPAAGISVPGCTVQLFSGTATYHLVETA